MRLYLITKYLGREEGFFPRANFFCVKKSYIRVSVKIWYYTCVIKGSDYLLPFSHKYSKHHTNYYEPKVKSKNLLLRMYISVSELISRENVFAIQQSRNFGKPSSRKFRGINWSSTKRLISRFFLFCIVQCSMIVVVFSLVATYRLPFLCIWYSCMLATSSRKTVIWYEYWH